MRDRSILARPRLPILGLTAVLAAAVVITVLTDGIEAKPPVAASAIPQEAFTPLTSLDDWRPPLLDRAADRGASEPTAIPSPSAPPAAPARPAGPVHIVKRGDTLWDIARWHAADLAGVLRWNPGIDPGRLVAGQRIFVPGGSPMLKPAVAKLSVVRAPTPRPRLVKLTPRPVGPLDARHLWPLAVRGTVTTRFSSAHLGIDIAAPAGTRVRAVAAGTVTWAGWKDGGGGYVVVLRHPDGMISTYNHNRAVAVERGERVDAGETIAWVGSSGWSTGPHLDFRIEMGGGFVDPLRFL